MLGRFRGPETATLHFLIIATCPSYTAVRRRRSSLLCCRRPHLEQFASTRHVRTLYVCFPSTTEGFSLQPFLSLNSLPQLKCLRSNCRHFWTLKSFFFTYLTHIQVFQGVIEGRTKEEKRNDGEMGERRFCLVKRVLRKGREVIREGTKGAGTWRSV